MEPACAVNRVIRLAEIFSLDAIVVGLEHRTKEGVIRELVRHLVGLGNLDRSDEEEAIRCILDREKLGSTALGNGMAFPHCRMNGTTRFVGVLGLDACGMPFDALDNRPVHAIFLLVAPMEGRELHYEILGRLSAIGRDKSQKIQLTGCRTAGEAHHFLQELDRV